MYDLTAMQARVLGCLLEKKETSGCPPGPDNFT